MKKPLPILLILLSALCITNAYAKDQKWYRVEMIVFEMDDKSGDDVSTLSKPSVANAVSLGTSSDSDYAELTDKQLSLQTAKTRLQKRYPILMHKGWRQNISDKEHSQKVHIQGGKTIDGEREVDGTVRLSLGRNLNVEADLVLKKVNGQSFRLKESSRLRVDEITYIDHPKYGVLVMVTPEKTQTSEKSQSVENATTTVTKSKAPLPVTDDSPILPSQREAMLKKGT
ncbi:MAG: hypothetical protein JSR17_11275 [Proteobacteria bacterium]|nr:hypothetical protein [Pseudomonadota bacterium]